MTNNAACHVDNVLKYDWCDIVIPFKVLSMLKSSKSSLGIRALLNLVRLRYALLHLLIILEVLVGGSIKVFYVKV